LVFPVAQLEASPLGENLELDYDAGFPVSTFDSSPERRKVLLWLDVYRFMKFGASEVFLRDLRK